MKRRIKVLLSTIPLLFVLTGVAQLSAGAQTATPSGSVLLQRMQQARKTTSYSAQRTIWRKQSPVIKTQIWRAGDKRRIEYIEPPIRKGDITVNDGKYTWRYHRSENSVIQTPNSHNNRAGRGSNRNFNVTNEGATTIGGRKAWIVTIKSQKGAPRTRKFWIDQQTYLRLRTELYDTKGQRTETMQLGSLNVSAVPASLFQWKTPRGAKVNSAGELYSRLERAKRQAPWMRVPNWVPAGYVFESAVINKSKNEVWLRYSSGTNRFSIFEQRTNDTSIARPRTVSGSLFWRNKGMRFLIAGLTEADAKRVAGNI